MSWPAGGVPNFTGGTELTAAELNVVVAAFNALYPLGASIYITGRTGTTVETLINGIWLEMNGVAISRTTYADLNSLYSGASYPYGSGDGSTTFNLPPANGRTLVGNPGSTGASSTKTLGAHDGLSLGSMTFSPTVSVSISGTTGSESSHTHSLSFSDVGVTGGGAGVLTSGTTGAGSAHSHSFSGSGSGAAAVPFLSGGIWVVKAFA